MKGNEIRKPASVEQIDSERQQTSMPLPPVVLSLGPRGQRAFELDLKQARKVLELAYSVSPEIGTKTRESVTAHLTNLAKNLKENEQLQKAS